MGGGAGAETTTKKALGATASAGDGASVPPVEQQKKKKQKPASLVAGSGVTDDDGSAAAVRQSCGEEDLEDEQVERFYALLANIRALRGLYSAGTGPAAACRKRAREAEPPWTPAFRLEDFEVEEEEEVNQNQGGTGAADARCPVMNHGGSGGVARRPAASVARARADEDDGGVAEAARVGNKLGRRRRVAARG